MFKSCKYSHKTLYVKLIDMVGLYLLRHLILLRELTFRFFFKFINNIEMFIFAEIYVETLLAIVYMAH